MSAFTCQADASGTRLELSGALTMPYLAQAYEQLKSKKGSVKEIDIAKLDALDTGGALLLLELGPQVTIRGETKEQHALLERISKLEIKPQKKAKAIPASRRTLIALGKATLEAKVEGQRILTFTGRAAVALAGCLRQPQRVRWNSVAHHIEAVGIRALPIIGLIAFLIAIVLAYQGVAQLRPYGGEQFTVNLVAISILREMGVLLTAIMVAGRSGSAFTAEIGVMKAREEVDALEVIGVDPFEILVVPRLIAIILALPLLTFFANMMGIIGGYFITHSLIDIGLEDYLNRVHHAVRWKDYFVGMVKAPVFAFFIGLIGCMHGLRVSGSSESIGRETTSSVVKGIFLVLVLDAFFSILFQQVGL